MSQQLKSCVSTTGRGRKVIWVFKIEGCWKSMTRVLASEATRGQRPDDRDTLHPRGRVVDSIPMCIPMTGRTRRRRLSWRSLPHFPAEKQTYNNTYCRRRTVASRGITVMAAWSVRETALGMMDFEECVEHQTRKVVWYGVNRNLVLLGC